MNYDLAIMALEGMARAPMTIRADAKEVVIEGEPESFKELARLCLLLGGQKETVGESFELQPGVHLTETSLMLKLVVRS